MSTMPWGTMNGWLRLETEQRGTWLQQRVQDLRAAQVARQPESEGRRLSVAAADRQPEGEGQRLTMAAADLKPQAVPACAEAEAQAEAVAHAEAA